MVVLNIFCKVILNTILYQSLLCEVLSHCLSTYFTGHCLVGRLTICLQHQKCPKYKTQESSYRFFLQKKFFHLNEGFEVYLKSKDNELRNSIAPTYFLSYQNGTKKSISLLFHFNFQRNYREYMSFKAKDQKQLIEVEICR